MLNFNLRNTTLAAVYNQLWTAQRLKTTLSTYFFTNPIYQQKQLLHEK